MKISVGLSVSVSSRSVKRRRRLKKRQASSVKRRDGSSYTGLNLCRSSVSA